MAQAPAVAKMISELYEKLLTERESLCARISQLKLYMGSSAYQQLPVREMALIQAQEGYMLNYLHILDKRLDGAVVGC